MEENLNSVRRVHIGNVVMKKDNSVDTADLFMIEPSKEPARQMILNEGSITKELILEPQKGEV